MFSRWRLSGVKEGWHTTVKTGLLRRPSLANGLPLLSQVVSAFGPDIQIKGLRDGRVVIGTDISGWLFQSQMDTEDGVVLQLVIDHLFPQLRLQLFFLEQPQERLLQIYVAGYQSRGHYPFAVGE